MMWAAIIEVDQVYNFDPMLLPVLRRQKLLCTGRTRGLWSELLDRPERIAEYQTYPRLCALSEVAWSPLERKIGTILTNAWSNPITTGSITWASVFGYRLPKPCMRTDLSGQKTPIPICPSVIHMTERSRMPFHPSTQVP